MSTNSSEDCSSEIIAVIANYFINPVCSPSGLWTGHIYPTNEGWTARISKLDSEVPVFAVSD